MAAPITVVCTNCSAKLSLKDADKIGQKIRCPKCSEPFVAQALKAVSPARSKVSKPSEPELDDYEEELDEEEIVERPSSKSKNSRGKKKGKRGSGTSNNQMPLLIGAGVVVLVLGLGGWLLLKGKSTPPAVVAENQTTSVTNAALQPAATLPAPGPAVAGGPAALSNEPFDVPAFLADRVAPQDNAAGLYPEVFSEVNEDVAAANPAPARENRVAAAKNFRLAIDIASDPDKIRSGAISPIQLEKLVNLAQPVITKMTAAQSKPDCELKYNHHFNFTVAPIKPLESLTRLCNIETFFARQKGDWGRAKSSIARTLRLSRDLRRRAPMIFQMVSANIDTVILTRIVDCTLSQPGLTVDQTDQLMALLVEHQQRGLDGLHEGLRSEYVIAKNTMEDLQSGRLTPQKLIDMGGNGMTSAPQLEAELRNKNWPAEFAALNRMTSELLSNASKLPAELPADWAAKLIAKMQAENATLAVMLMGSRIDQYFLAINRDKARVALTIALTAVRRYQLAHGMVPADLPVALQEAKLTTPLIDPFSGQPLRYAILNGKPTAYSVGSDLIDQGGKIDWQNGKQPGDFILTIAD